MSSRAKVKAVRGTQDILPHDAPRWRHAERLARSVAMQYGYREIRTPLLEEAQLFYHSVGETTDIVEKEMYEFEDAKGRHVALRPEGTAAVVRAFIEHDLGRDLPLCKLFYMGLFFRHERPQAGRRRQFSQFGVEALGSPHPAVDAEVIALGQDYTQRLGLKNLVIAVNSVGCSRCQPGYREELVQYLKGRTPELCEDCRERVARNPIRVLDCKRDGCRHVMGGGPKTIDSLCDDCRAHFSSVRSILESYGISSHVDPKQVRGLDYYSRTTFEVLTEELGAQNAILAGGRYDWLVEALGGSASPGVGFAAGLDRILLLLDTQGKAIPVDEPRLLYMIPLGESCLAELLPVANRLRRGGVAVDISYEGGGLKRQLRVANRLGFGTVLIRGEDEQKRGVAILRDMDSGKQEEVAWAVIESVLAGRFGEGAGCGSCVV